MLAKTESFILSGIDALLCEVEVDANQSGVEKTVVVGLAQAAVKESIERVRRAIINSGFPFLANKLLINLAPADVKKEAVGLDLPMALGVLRATKCLNTDRHREFLVAGELALDGRVRKIKGALSLALLAKEKKFRGVIVPQENAREAAVVTGVEVYPVTTLAQAVAFLSDALPLEPFGLDGEAYEQSKLSATMDFGEVRGQEAVKRAITIACGGSHNLLMIGPPGTGKSMLAARIPGILPPLDRNESLETTRIYSAMGLLPAGVALMDERPVRTPHHSATAQALIGGGSIPRPGEVSLAHHGILFLDELPEFPRHVLETLRQPMESGQVTVSRVHGTINFPAQFMLVAAMNPTASGYSAAGGNSSGAPPRRDKYLSKISGPLLDRIDLHVEVPAVPYRELTGKRTGTDSATMRERVRKARAAQARRFGTGMSNARMDSRQLRAFCDLSEGCLRLLQQAMEEMGLSARAYDKVRRVARTIADIDGAEQIGEVHLAEAIQYRLLDRKF
jgi:magnesium chelatase family protein